MSAINKIMHGNWMMESSGYGFDELGYIGEGGENMSIVERARAELAALEAVAEAAEKVSKWLVRSGLGGAELSEKLDALRKAQE